MALGSWAIPEGRKTAPYLCPRTSRSRPFLRSIRGMTDMQFAATGRSDPELDDVPRMMWLRTAMPLPKASWVIRETAPVYGLRAGAREEADEQALTALGE